MPNIVLIEDDDDDIYFFKSACIQLEKHINLIVLRDGAELVNYVAEYSVFDTIFMLDLNMPKLGGFDALKQISQHPHFTQMVVITYTTSSRDKDIQQAYQLGAKSYLLKPNSTEEIKALIAQVIHYWFELNACAAEVNI